MDNNDLTLKVLAASSADARAAHFEEHDIKVDVLRKNLDKCLDQLGAVVGDLETRSVGNWGVDTFSVSLAVTAQGSIGIVTADLQASILVNFTRTKTEPRT